MKKRLALSLLSAGIVLLGFFLIRVKNAPATLVFHEPQMPEIGRESQTAITLTEFDEIRLSVDGASACPTGCTAAIQSASKEAIAVSSGIFYIMHPDGINRWAEVPPLTEDRCSWKTPVLLGYFQTPGSRTPIEYVEELDWEPVYGSLPAGRYLLVREIFDPQLCSLGYAGTAFRVSA